MDSSPFNRSSKTSRSPPPTPQRPPPPLTEDMEQDAPEVVTTPQIQAWMTEIEKCLSEICAISAEGKLNTDQKLKISNLCRNVSSGTSQLAVLYQSLKHRALSNHAALQTLMEKLDLSENLRGLKEKIDVTSNASTVPLFSDMVKNSSKVFVRPNNFSSVAIYPNNKQKTSEETKSLVQKIINPGEMKLHVRGLRKVKNGGVVISTDTRQDLEKLKQTVQQSSSDLTIDEPYKRKPRISIVGVPSSMQERDLFKCIYDQNLAEKIQDLTRETFLTSIKLSHKSGKKDAETCNYVLEVPSDIRKALISQNRVFINWSSCPVRDFTLVTRCFKCQQYGHAAKSCKQVEYTCGHCANMGHSIKECPKKEEPPKCATCSLYKKPSNHRTGEVDCPAKKNAEQRYINSIDYGGA